MVAAGVDIAGLRITLGMGGDDQAVQLAHDQQFGAGLAGVDIGIEAGNVAGQGQCVACLLYTSPFRCAGAFGLFNDGGITLKAASFAP